MNKQNFLNQRELIDQDSGLLATSLRAFVLPAAICMAGMTLFWSLPAKAQSFSCASADNAAQFAICNDETLLALDEKISDVFADQFINASTSPARQAVAREHTQWMKSRDACGADFTCLKLRYDERVKVLSSRSS